MYIETITRQVSPTSSRTSKKTKRYLICRCDNCGIVFERKYQKCFLKAINDRGYVGCSKRCGALLRERNMSPEKRRDRAVARSRSMTARNIRMHSIMSRDKKIDMYDRIANSVKSTYAKMSDDERRRHRRAISHGTKKAWRERRSEILKKQFEGYKRSWSNGIGGNRFMSNVERAVGDALIDILGSSEVIRQHVIFGRCVDIYLPRYDLCVEIDGVYWHGLDVPFSQLFANRHVSRRDMKRLRRYINDRRLDDKFTSSNMTLCRIIAETIIDPYDTARRIVRDHCREREV